MPIKKGSPEHAAQVAETLAELAADEGGVLHGHPNIHASDHCGFALAYWRKAESERDEARLAAQWWRDCARDFDEPGSMHPRDYLLPWEREGGDE